MVKFGIGQAITRREDDRLLTGKACYVDDVRMPGALHAMFVRSPHAHARVTAIDVSEALATAGVVAVLTGADLKADGVGAFPPNPMLKPDAAKSVKVSFPALAIDVVRFVGQPVAVVLAESRAAAEVAVNLVQVDYDALSAVASLDAALAPSAPCVWPGARSNVVGKATYGDRAACEKAFAAAAHRVAITIDNQRLAPVTLEPRGCVAEFDAASGRVTVHASSQNPAGFQATIAQLLALPPEKVRVVVGDVGGGFGMKALVHPEDIVCAHAARKLARPVRWRSTRLEEFQASSHGRDQRAEAELALDRDGRIMALRVRITGSIGAYGHAAGACYPSGDRALGDNRCLSRAGARPAGEGGADPHQCHRRVSRRGPARGDLPDRTADGSRGRAAQDGPGRAAPTQPGATRADALSQCDGRNVRQRQLQNLLDRALAAADWAGFDERKRASQARGRLRGRAVSTFLEWTGALAHEETVRLHVEGDGRVRVFTAMQAMGQGIETSYLQILAETLQLDPGRIELVHGDSDVAQGIGSMGSRSLYIGGSAMQTASQQTIDEGRTLAARALEAPAADLVYTEGRYQVVGTDLGIDLAALAQRQPERRIAVTTVQKVGGPSWPNGCHICEVEVEPETGQVEIVRYTTVDDVGRVINPLIVAGQVHGGIAQAVGQALMERVVYDADGQLLTGSFMDYGIPRADDLPSFVTYTDESQPCKINPLGAKGVGELGAVGGTPTVINAIVDALRPLGVTDLAMPATPERVWRAIRDARKAA